MNSKEFDASVDMLDFVFTDYISDLRKISKFLRLDPSFMSEQEKIKTSEAAEKIIYGLIESSENIHGSICEISEILKKAVEEDR